MLRLFARCLLLTLLALAPLPNAVLHAQAEVPAAVVDLSDSPDTPSGTEPATETLAGVAIDQESLFRSIDQGMDLWQVPGMAVAVVRSNKVLFQATRGTTAEQRGQDIDGHTLFAAASTTKAMVCAGILMLRDDGLLQLDDPVIRHLPELHLHDPALTQQLTISDLLAHRTGLPSTDFWTFFQGMDLDEQVQRLASVPPEAPLRSRLIYQNTMYELAGLIIERLTGQRWDEFLRQRLWLPLGMNETYGARGQIPSEHTHVRPHFVLGSEVTEARWDLPADLANAAGSTWTSLHDMSRWAQFLLRGGRTEDGQRLLSENSFALMFEPLQLAAPDDFYPTVELTQPNWRSYSLGWFQQDFQGRRVDFHTGSLGGLIALIGLDRVNDLALVVLGNRDHAEMRHALLWEVMDASPAESRRDWNQEIWDLYQRIDEQSEARWVELRQQRLPAANPVLPLADFAGRYQSPVNGDMVVAHSDRRLLLKTAMVSFELKHWHLNTFVVEYTPWNMREFASFRVGADGKVSGMDWIGDHFQRAR